MSIIDTYLSCAYRALAENDLMAIDKTAREIVSAFHAEIPNISNYRGGSVSSGNGFEVYSDRHTADNLRQLIGKLKVLRESKDREIYGACGLSTITEHIRELEDALYEGLDENAVEQLYERIDHVYANCCQTYTDGLSGWLCSSYEPCEEQTRMRIDKLRHYRDKEYRDLKAAEATSTNFSVNNNNTATATNFVNIDFSVVVEQIDKLPEESLTDEEKTLLKGMVADLQGKDEGKRNDKFGKLLRWLSTRGVDVAIAVLPYIAQLIQKNL